MGSVYGLPRHVFEEGLEDWPDERVWDSILDGRLEGVSSVIGLMLESNLEAGTQAMPSEASSPAARKAALAYGVSVTDACLDWQTTQRLLLEGAARLRDRR